MVTSFFGVTEEIEQCLSLGVGNFSHIALYVPACSVHAGLETQAATALALMAIRANGIEANNGKSGHFFCDNMQAPQEQRQGKEFQGFSTLGVPSMQHRVFGSRKCKGKL